MIILFETYCYLVNIVLLFLNYWSFFFKNNFLYLKLRFNFFEKFNKINFSKKLNFRIFLRFSLITSIFYFFSFFITKGSEFFFFWNHFHFTNFVLYLILFILMFNIIWLFILNLASKNLIFITAEYIFSLSNIIGIIPLLFLSNTVYTLFFSLEGISCLLFYKFTVSKFWLNAQKYGIDKSYSKFLKIYPRYFVNVLFFQYWASFFSSVLILVSLVLIFSFYDTSEFFFINYFYRLSSNSIYKSNLLYITVPLFLGLIIKLGISPFHMYKIEIYKGLPLVSLFFYTTFYFLIYWFFFFVFIFFFFYSHKFILSVIILVIFFLSIAYLISVLFDGFIIKMFLSLSTILNSLNFIILLLITL